jgi:hypothetical protein
MPRRRFTHHFSGSIYAEPILEDAIAEDFYLNTTTMEVLMEKPARKLGEILCNK